MPATTPTPISEKKLAANRANATKSTGPRTPTGKRRSSRNATTHAGYAADLVLPSESAANFLALRRAMLASLSPQTPFELCLVDRAANLLWRLNRLQAAETGLLASEEADFTEHARDFAEDYNARPENEAHPRRVPPKRLAPADLPPGLATVLFFERPDNPLDRLSRTEHRLQGMLHRTLNQLTALQARRESPHHTPLPCPYLYDDEDNVEEGNDDFDEDPTPEREGEAPPEPRVPRDTPPEVHEEHAHTPTPDTPMQPDATATEKVQNEPTTNTEPRTQDHDNAQTTIQTPITPPNLPFPLSPAKIPQHSTQPQGPDDRR